jgi:hypothetical protein
MDIRPLGKNIRRVTVFERDGSGPLRPSTVYKCRRSRKRQTQGLKPLERVVRTAADAGEAFSGTYGKRHRRSNNKRKDGWLRDSAANLAKAGDRARKQLDLVRLLGW